jgi:cytochrome c oxidase assembly protein subunit 15
LFENPLMVQFDHRMLAYAVVIVAIGQAIWLVLKRAPTDIVGTALLLACLVLMQATLGVWTLLLAVPIPLGLAHQAGAIAVFAAAVYHLWLTARVPTVARAQAATSA